MGMATLLILLLSADCVEKGCWGRPGGELLPEQLLLSPGTRLQEQPKVSRLGNRELPGGSNVKSEGGRRDSRKAVRSIPKLPLSLTRHQSFPGGPKHHALTSSASAFKPVAGGKTQTLR